jgi:hypothetical protein
MLTSLITEEFHEGQDYYHYLYYPSNILAKLLYALLIVFTESQKYTVPIVISIVNLILCIFYIVAYIVSVRPFVYMSDTLLSLFMIVLEIMFLFVPLLYTVEIMDY